MPKSPAQHPAETQASRPPSVPPLPITRVCVLAAFGPGRPWTGDKFYSSFHNLLAVEEHIELDLVVMDNRAPHEGGLWELLGALATTTSELVRRRIFVRDTAQVNRARDGAVALSAHVARLKNAMLDAVPADTDWVLSVEPDVEVPEPKPERVTVLRQMLDVANSLPALGILGCPIRSRQGRHLMVYHAASLDPWRLDRKARRAGTHAEAIGDMLRKPASGRIATCPRNMDRNASPEQRLTQKGGPLVEAVDSVSLGLTLIRAGLLRGFRFAATPNADGTGGAGHEWSLMKHARLRGWQVACHWGIQPRHFDSPDKWV